MSKLKNYLVVLSVLFAAQCRAQPKEQHLRFSLEECIAYAIENSLNQQTLKLDRESSEVSYRQSRRERLPQIYGTASQSVTGYSSAQAVGENPAWAGNYALNASMNLWSGGQINLTVRQNELLTKLTDYELKQAENNLTINVIQAFLSITGYEELLKYQHEALLLSETQAEMGKVKLKAGQIIESDCLLLEAQLASDKFNMADSENARDNSLLALRNLLSLTPEQSLEIIIPDHEAISSMLLLPALSSVVELALGNMPELQIAKQNISLAENNVKISLSGYSPKLTLNAGIGTGYGSGEGAWGNQLSNRFNQNISLNLSIPIYSNGKNKSNVQQSRISVEQTKLRYSQAELDIMQLVEQEYQNIATVLKKYSAAEIKHTATEASFRAYEKQFAAGSITVADLLLQKNNHINAFNEYVQSKYSYILERKILDIYMGVN